MKDLHLAPAGTLARAAAIVGAGFRAYRMDAASAPRDDDVRCAERA